MVTSGIYVTETDYKKNKLIEEADCKNNKASFKKHDFFSKSFFTVINKGKKLTYLKKDIYAYRDCQNTTWRFYDNNEYEIKEANNLYIYTLEKVVLNTLTLEKDPIYYFSKGAGGEVKELTVDNLKAGFINNQVFHNMLDTQIKSDKDLSAFDVVHKMYKVNYLHSECVK